MTSKRFKFFPKWDKLMEEKWMILRSKLVGVLSNRVKRHSIKWKDSGRNCLKLNFDGANKGNQGDEVFGAIIRDHTWRIILVVMGFMRFTTNNEVELEALESGLDLRFRKIIT
ncbi:hypothetical protein SUGI_0840690 [Cryptomeria japonica]|nr:hypothetical protein SUGI_0840690 [Cryptomeria japonica]